MEKRYEEIYHAFLLPFEATLFAPHPNQDDLTSQTNELLKLVDRLLTSSKYPNRPVRKGRIVNATVRLGDSAPMFGCLQC